MSRLATQPDPEKWGEMEETCYSAVDFRLRVCVHPTVSKQIWSHGRNGRWSSERTQTLGATTIAATNPSESHSCTRAFTTSLIPTYFRRGESYACGRHFPAMA